MNKRVIYILLSMALAVGLIAGVVVYKKHKKRSHRAAPAIVNPYPHEPWKENVRMGKTAVYNGQWSKKRKAPQGYGVMRYGKDSLYVGFWENGKRKDMGRLVRYDRKVVEYGIWNGYKLVKPMLSKAQAKLCYGIDISRWQKRLRWDELAFYAHSKSGNISERGYGYPDAYLPVSFVIIKASQDTKRDPLYKDHIYEARRHAMVVGSYHYLKLDGASGKEQARAFLKYSQWKKGDLPPVLDVENEKQLAKVGEKKMRQMIHEWLDEVERRTDVKPIIYSYANFHDRYLKGKELSSYTLWLAHYSGKRQTGGKCKIWQRTDKGRIVGYNDKIDIDAFDGSYFDLIDYTLQ